MPRPGHKTTPRDIWGQQRYHAKQRGIPFLFEFEEWLAWWKQHLGDDWQSKRGRTKGRYVMARFGDVGPYHPSNVKCILHSKNVSEAMASVDEVTARYIYTARESYAELQKMFGLTFGTVANIRVARYCYTYLASTEERSIMTRQRK